LQKVEVENVVKFAVFRPLRATRLTTECVDD